MLKSNNFDQYCDISIPISKYAIVKDIERVVHNTFCNDWLDSINRDTGSSKKGRNKLRTYRLFKNEYGVEKYCTLILPPRHRSALSKFRCGVAPIRLETGRYEGLPVQERKCPFCDSVEDESHVILECALYNDIRESLFDKANHFDNTFYTMSNPDKLVFLFTHFYMIRDCAKACFNILQRRKFYVCK